MYCSYHAELCVGLDGSGSNMSRRSGTGCLGGDGSDTGTTGGLDQGQNYHSRPGSSRPVSSRPMSSKNRIGSGVGNRQSFDGKNKKGNSMEV